MSLRLSMRNVFKSLAATGSVLTMVFAPVAHGYQAEDTLKKQIESFMTETQLSKRITYKEFWNKTKHLYSGQVYADVERYLMSSPNELMPEFTLKESVSSTGEKIPTLTISEKGKSYQMQIFGEKTKFAKFNNVVLTENDLMLITPAMKRIMASDIKIKKAHDKNLIKANSEKFSGTPKITREMWKKLSPMQRAQFMLNLRLLYSGAADVMNAKEALDLKKSVDPKKGKKTSSLEGGTASPLQKWNNFFALLNGEVEAFGVGSDCVVAGYIGKYGADKKCKYPSEALTAAKSQNCSMPCNPTIYGYNNGGLFCLTNSAELQTATHRNQGCDVKMPLTAVIDALPKSSDPTHGSKRYEGVAERNKTEALAEFNKNQKVQDLSKNYLASMLKEPQKTAFLSGNIDDALLAELQKIQKNFDDTIGAARTACAAAADNKEQYDKNFEGACDQLHRRFLFVAESLAVKPGCPGSKAINPETLKCSCEGGEVLPGTPSCPVVSSPTEQEVSVSGTTEVEPEKLQCTNGTVEKEGSCVCEDGKEPSGKDKKCGSGFNWKPWLIGAGIIGGAALLYFLFKKKKKDKPDTPVVTPPQGCTNVCAANTTLNPTTCACDPIVQQPTCQAPQVLTNGVCACPAVNACTPGQQVYNLSTCQCDTVVQQGICPDGVTQYFTPPGPATCPAPTQCQNGTQVYPPNVCPPVTEGGSGNNCPSGNCSGGVPSAN